MSLTSLVTIDKGVVEILPKEDFTKIGPMNCVTLREAKIFNKLQMQLYCSMLLYHYTLDSNGPFQKTDNLLGECWNS